jgi:hypothetical protein
MEQQAHAEQESLILMGKITTVIARATGKTTNLENVPVDGPTGHEEFQRMSPAQQALLDRQRVKAEIEKAANQARWGRRMSASRRLVPGVLQC